MALTNTSYASNEQTTQTFRGAFKAEVAVIFLTVDITTSPAILFAGSVVRSVSDGKLYLSNGTIFEQIQGKEETALTIKQKYESNSDTNVFTDAEKNKLQGLQNYDDTSITNALANKVDKEAGKGLSEENYTASEKSKLASITEIFTTALKNAYDSAITWISTNGSALLSHLSRTDNPHDVTAAQIGVEAGAQVNDINTTLQGNSFNIANKLVQLDSNAKVPVSLLDYKVAVLNYVTDIATFASDEDTIVVKDSVRGGVFNKYTGASASDGGVIFTDANTNKWIRQIGDHVSIRWYDTTDMNPVMDKISTLITAGLVPKRVYIPTGTYEFSAPYTITVGMMLFGDGMQRSIVRFPTNMAGFTLTYLNIYDGYTFKDFSILGRSASAPGGTPLYSNWDVNAHGITMARVCIFENIEVNGFAGNGIYGNASVPSNNINNSQFIGVKSIQNKLHGVKLDGSDSNALKFINCDFSSNSGCGVYDSSFLGNYYFGCHFATNGSLAIAWGARGYTKAVDGNIYVCIDPTGSCVNIEPTVTAGWANSWLLASFNSGTWPGNTVPAYDATITYIVTKSIWCDGDNQEGVLVGCYGESDQQPGFIGQRMLVFGGNLIASANFIKATLNYIFTSRPLKVYSSVGITGGVSTQMLPDGKGFQIIDGANGISIDYNKATNESYLKALGATLLYLQNAIISGRLYCKIGTLLSSLLLINGKPGGTPTIHTVYLHNNVSNRIYEDVEESVAYKTRPVNNTGGSPLEYVRLGGYMDIAFTTTDATPVNKVETLIRVFKFFKFEVEVSAINTANNEMLYVKKEVIGKFDGTTITLIKDVNIEEVKDASLTDATVLYSYRVNSGNQEYVKIECTGIAATTIKWNLRIKRTLL